MISETPFYRLRLDQEFARRCAKNPRYSLRSFARALGVSNGALSQILSQKRVPSVRVAERLITNLGLDSQERENFLTSLAGVQRSRPILRMAPLYRDLASDFPKAKIVARNLSVDHLNTIGSWYHLAILELTFVDKFKIEAAPVAGALGITHAQARLAIEQLKRLELLSIHSNGRLIKTNGLLATVDREQTALSLRRLQKDFLEKSMNSLEADSIDDRSHTSMTMAIDPMLVPLAKTLIENFARSLCEALETGQRRRVYNFQAALYPLQKTSSPARRKRK